MRHANGWKLGLAGAVVVACALVFLSYLQPEFMVDLSNRIISCF